MPATINETNQITNHTRLTLAMDILTQLNITALDLSPVATQKFLAARDVISRTRTHANNLLHPNYPRGGNPNG